MYANLRILFSVLFLLLSFSSAAKVTPKVKCQPNQMRIEIPITASTKSVYVESLRDYPDPACRPHTDPSGTLAVLEFDLRDVYRCAVTRVINKQTGKHIYYQSIVIEHMENNREGVAGAATAPSSSLNETKETLHVKCSIYPVKNHTISKRNVLPAGFQEAEDVNITTSFEEHAPEPLLGVGVRQAGKLVTGELNVSPGSPLQMEIFLDKESAPIYGLLVTHMRVTDMKTEEETIIFNGCSVDPYVFENFNTVDGDFLVAKFRAFKFPESTYVQFRGTVNVCLDKCKGVECSDGKIGYGRRRRRRAIPTLPADPNKIFEITITSFIKVGGGNSFEEEEMKLVKNQTKIYNNKKLIVGNQMTDDRRFYKTVNANSQPEIVAESKTEERDEEVISGGGAVENVAANHFTNIIMILNLVFVLGTFFIHNY